MPMAIVMDIVVMCPGIEPVVRSFMAVPYESRRKRKGRSSLTGPSRLASVEAGLVLAELVLTRLGGSFAPGQRGGHTDEETRLVVADVARDFGVARIGA